MGRPRRSDEEGSSRDRIIKAASALLEERGYHGSGIAEIVARSEAPKGSVYFHFPGGKEQIAAEAVAYAASVTAARIREGIVGPGDAAEAIASFTAAIADHVEASGFAAGGPLLIVAAETAAAGGPVNEACRAAYDRLRSPVEERLRAAGLPEARARELGLAVIAAIEGGIVLSRTYRTGAPLRVVAGSIRDLVAAALAAGRDEGGQSAPQATASSPAAPSPDGAAEILP